MKAWPKETPTDIVEIAEVLAHTSPAYRQGLLDGVRERVDDTDYDSAMAEALGGASEAYRQRLLECVQERARSGQRADSQEPSPTLRFVPGPAA